MNQGKREVLAGLRIAFYSTTTEKHKGLITYFKKQAESFILCESLIYSKHLDLIVIDASFPYLRIFKFLKWLQRIPSTACVVMIGPELESGKVSALLRGGVFDYLKIPFSIHRLEKTIRKGLKNQEGLLSILNLSNELEKANESLCKERDLLQKWNDDLNNLYTLNQVLSESLDIKQIVDTLFKNILKVVPHDLSCIFLKSWDQVQVEADTKLWGGIIEQVKEETRKDSEKYLEKDFPGPQAIVCHGGAEIIVPLSVGVTKIGLLRLIRMTRHRGPDQLSETRTDAGEPIKVFNEYQAKLLSMIAVPLAIAIRNAEMYRQVEDMSVKDPLTNVLNRRSFSGILEREFKRANRYETPLTLMIIDLDHFKKVNDTYGHLAGDHILREMAQTFKQDIRDVDVLIRYGGEEFVLILPGTDLDSGRVVANRIKNKVDEKMFQVDGMKICMSVSIGVANYLSGVCQSPEELFKQADQALYLAKKKGRNQIVYSTSEVSGERNDAMVLEEQETR